MKKLTITTLLLAIFICSQAQEATDESKTSKFVLGGSIALEYSQNTFQINKGVINQPSTSSLISIAPYLGYNIGMKWMIGIKIGYKNFNDYYDGTRKLQDNQYFDYIVKAINGNEISIVPFLRFSNTIGNSKLGYYFDVNAGTKFSIDMKAEYGYDWNTDYGYYKYNNYYVSSDFGLLFNFTDKVGVEFALSFLQIEFTDEEFTRKPDAEAVLSMQYKSLDIKFLPELFIPNIGININL